MKKYKAVIVGGGFSGLVAAVCLGKVWGGDVLLLEANKRVGKKILATGNGQGNLTNANVSADFYHGDKAFAARALEKHSNKDMLNFFSSLGLITVCKGGKYYPACGFAGAICDVLRFAVADYGVQTQTECRVERVTKKSGGVFEICASGEKYYAENIILAFGGASGSGFGTDGKSYFLATDFGHKLTKLSPSLVQLKTEREKIRGLKGIKTEAKVALYDGKRLVRAFEGDLLFTDYGVSGNSVFSISAYVGECVNPFLSVEFLPRMKKEELEKSLFALAKKGYSVERAFVSVLPSRLVAAVAKSAGRSLADRADERAVRDIIDELKDFKLKVEGTAGFDNSQVTSGGIDLRAIGDDMQSKLVGGLYLVGEALNVDGDCGGYNLQWAWTSAVIACEALLNRA